MAQPFIAQGYRWKPVTWVDSDFDAGVDNGSAASTAGDVLEVASAEVGSDNQFAEYDAAMFGQPADDARKAGAVTEWKQYTHSNASEISTNAEFNIINRSKTSRDGPDITGWMSYNKLKQTTPSEQLGIPRQPKVALKGTVVAIQYRDTSTTNGVAWQTPAKTDEKALIPGYGGTLMESSRRR